MTKGVTFKIRRATDNQFYFVISGRNNEPICASETYRTKQSAKKTIKAIIDGCPGARIIDESGKPDPFVEREANAQRTLDRHAKNYE